MVLNNTCRRLVAVIFGMVLACSATAGSPKILVGQARVIDGDTIEMRGQRIRLHGIDAPESSQPCHSEDGTQWRCGQKSALALAAKIGRGHLSCRSQTTDHYGRLVAVCHFGDLDLNQWMVRRGWATAYKKYARDYIQDEVLAQQAGLGIWSGDFVRPDQWRQGTRHGPDDKVGHKPGCAIKGNISKAGSRIYHLPGMTWYDRTRINIAKGERWFCSEGEARTAGWRRAR